MQIRSWTCSITLSQHDLSDKLISYVAEIKPQTGDRINGSGQVCLKIWFYLIILTLILYFNIWNNTSQTSKKQFQNSSFNKMQNHLVRRRCPGINDGRVSICLLYMFIIAYFEIYFSKYFEKKCFYLLYLYDLLKSGIFGINIFLSCAKK